MELSGTTLIISKFSHSVTSTYTTLNYVSNEKSLFNITNTQPPLSDEYLYTMVSQSESLQQYSVERSMCRQSAAFKLCVDAVRLFSVNNPKKWKGAKYLYEGNFVFAFLQDWLSPSVSTGLTSAAEEQYLDT